MRLLMDFLLLQWINFRDINLRECARSILSNDDIIILGRFMGTGKAYRDMNASDEKGWADSQKKICRQDVA